jgi:hypothetical protein
MDMDAEPANDEHPEANGEEVEAATAWYLLSSR